MTNSASMIDVFSGPQGLLLPLVVLLLFKRINPPENVGLPILIAACIVGGYLLGRTKTGGAYATQAARQFNAGATATGSPNDGAVGRTYRGPRVWNSTCPFCGSRHFVHDDLLRSRVMCAMCDQIEDGRILRWYFEHPESKPPIHGGMKPHQGAIPDDVTLLTPLPLTVREIQQRLSNSSMR